MSGTKAMSGSGETRPSRSSLPHVCSSAHSGSPYALSPCRRSARSGHDKVDGSRWTQALLTAYSGVIAGITS